MWLLYLLIWLVIAILFLYPFAKSLYQHFHQYIAFTIKTDVPISDTNNEKGLQINIYNIGIKTLIIQEIGIFNADNNQYFAFKHLIDESSPLPTKLLPKEQATFTQALAKIPFILNNNSDVFKIYVKDYDGEYHYSNPK